MIELSTDNQTTRDYRNCPFRGPNLLNFSKYFFIRNNFYYKVKILILDITQLHANRSWNDEHI